MLDEPWVLGAPPEPPLPPLGSLPPVAMTPPLPPVAPASCAVELRSPFPSHEHATNMPQAMMHSLDASDVGIGARMLFSFMAGFNSNYHAGLHFAFAAWPSPHGDERAEAMVGAFHEPHGSQVSYF
jgi:hypothetical protein